MLLEARNIHKRFREIQVLKGIDVHLEESEIISIVGPSGAGKTTLLQILGTLESPDEGTITFNGIDITTFDANKLSVFRNQKIGFVFQFHHLLPEFTAIENIALPSMISGKSKQQALDESMSWLKYLNLESRSDNKPSELSGGEQQRIAVARSLINKPKVIFADEPSGNLDTANAKDLHNLFFKLRDDFGLGFVIVTHNEELATMTDRKLKMADGMMV